MSSYLIGVMRDMFEMYGTSFQSLFRVKKGDERFDMLSRTYEAQKKELEADVIRLEKEIEVQENPPVSAHSISTSSMTD